MPMNTFKDRPRGVSVKDGCIHIVDGTEDYYGEQPLCSCGHFINNGRIERGGRVIFECDFCGRESSVRGVPVM